MHVASIVRSNDIRQLGEELIATTPHRLIVTYQRHAGDRVEITRDGTKIVTPIWVKETINLVHPDDPRHERDGKKQANITFRQLGDMFRGNALYRNVEYNKVEAHV